MQTPKSQGPSGLDADKRHRLLTTFKTASSDLCNGFSKLTIRVATERLALLESNNSCGLIAVDKNPGLLPVGIGKTLRRAGLPEKLFWETLLQYYCRNYFFE